MFHFVKTIRARKTLCGKDVFTAEGLGEDITIYERDVDCPRCKELISQGFGDNDN